MNRSEDGDAFPPKEVQQIDQLDLPPDIQILRWLIQQQQLRFLREAQRNLHALTLSPAQFVEDSLLQPGHIREIQGPVDRHTIFSHRPPQKPEIERASLFHSLPHSKLKRDIKLLRNKRDRARHLPERKLAQRYIVQNHVARPALERTGSKAQNRRFARTIRPDQSCTAPCLQIEIRRLNYVEPTIPEANIAKP